MPSPSHVKRVGIAAPSPNAGLEMASGPEDGDCDMFAPPLALGVAKPGGAMAGETNGIPVGLADPVPAGVHAATRMVTTASHATLDRRMARLSTQVGNTSLP